MTHRSVVKLTYAAARGGAALLAAVAAVAVLVGSGSAPPVHAAPPVVAKDFSKPAIVILGYGLKESGAARPILYGRVLAGLAVAQMFPQSPVIVTGGNPRNGHTEAAEMRTMLRVLGFPDDRIIVEDRANSTVQNAQFAVPLAEQAGTSGIILVTSSSHQDRADGNFADAGGNVLATVSFPDHDPKVNVAQFVRDVLSPFVAIS